MAIELSPSAKALSQGVMQLPQLVLQIDGISTLYGVGSIKKYIRIGDPGLFVGVPPPGSTQVWKIGGYNNVSDQEDLISFEGTTTTITQQLLQDKGGTSSVSAIQIALIDLNEKATQLISPGIVVPDILGRKASVYLGYAGLAFPDDFIQIFNGIIDQTDGGPTVVIQVAHPEAGKRFDILQASATTLTAAANFRSATIQGLKYQARTSAIGAITIQYNAGGVFGLEVVSVIGNAISVLMQSGVSTATSIRNAIEKSIDALSLVAVATIKNQTTTPATPVGPVLLVSDTTLQVVSTQNFLTPADGGTIRTYVRIEDEVIEYTGLTDTTFTGCTREAFVDVDQRSEGKQHEIDTEVKSFIRLQGNAFDLALKIMLSGEDAYFLTEQKVTAFQNTPDFGVINNAIFFQGVNAVDKFGVVVGDFCTTTGDLFTENNVTLRTITDVVTFIGGSYIVVDGAPLTTNVNTAATISFRSKYNVLPAAAGLNLGGDQVDVPEFERLGELFFSSIFSYDFYLTDTEKGKDFIDTELLFPTGAYSIPRKGKISVGFTSPPLSVAILPVMDSDNVAKPQGNRLTRTINKYFYNNVVFKYNQNVLDTDRYLSGNIAVSGDSKDQIKVQNKSFTIQSRGLRPSTDNDVIIELISNRLLERYRFAAEFTKASVFYGDGLNVDVGDALLYGDQNLKLVDSRKGVRGFSKRIFEVVNKSLNIKSGEIILDLIDTSYLTDGRYGVFGPSSEIDTGSTTTSVRILNSFGTHLPRIEKSKWELYIGELVAVHDEDFTFYEEVTFKGFDPGDNFKMLVDPPLSMAPTAGMIIEQPNYPGTDPDQGAAYKNQHCFFDPTVAVVSAADETHVDVDPGDIGKFFEGASVIIHDEDWSNVSIEVKVDSIAGNTLTLSKALGLIPDNTYVIDLIGFVQDGGAAYRFI